MLKDPTKWFEFRHRILLNEKRRLSGKQSRRRYYLTRYNDDGNGWVLN